MRLRPVHMACLWALANPGRAPDPTRPATSGRAPRCRAARWARRGRPPWWSASPHWLPACTQNLAISFVRDSNTLLGCPPLWWHCPYAVAETLSVCICCAHNASGARVRQLRPRLRADAGSAIADLCVSTSCRKGACTCHDSMWAGSGLAHRSFLCMPSGKRLPQYSRVPPRSASTSDVSVLPKGAA